MSMVVDRMCKMNRKYIASNILTQNPLVLNLAKDFVEFADKCRIKNIETDGTFLSGNEDLFINENAWLIETSQDNTD